MMPCYCGSTSKGFHTHIIADDGLIIPNMESHAMTFWIAKSSDSILRKHITHANKVLRTKPASHIVERLTTEIKEAKAELKRRKVK